MAIKDWLPNFQVALNNFYDERLKNALETKSSEFKNLLQQKSTEYQQLLINNTQHWQKTQQALVAIALGIFFLLLIAYFWK